MKQSSKLLSFFLKLSVPWLVFTGLMFYSIVLTVLTGDIGFQGDDWWVLSYPFWYGFKKSLLIYAQEFLRPIEGMYWIGLYRIFGFNKIVFHFFSLTLLAVSVLLMGLCLDRAFPNRRSFIAGSMLFAFFFPAVSSLTFIIATDNSRLCALFFWASTLAFQYWASRDFPLGALIIAVFLYLLSTSTYEAASLLIFSIPLFVWPVFKKNHDRLLWKHFAVHLFAALIVGFFLFVAIRYTLLSGGPVSLKTFPSAHAILSYVLGIWKYLLPSLNLMRGDTMTVLMAVGMALFFITLIYNVDVFSENPKNKWETLSILLAGISVLILGMSPYIIAGYDLGFGFVSQSRVYSTASYGMAIFFGFLISCWSNKKILFSAKLIGVLLISVHVILQLELRKDWQEAARINKNIWRSLVEQAPDVSKGTTFLFLDLQSYIGDRAVVVAGVPGLDKYIEMVYADRSINAYYLYLNVPEFDSSEGRLANVSSDGITPRGTSTSISLDSLLIFQREGDRLILLDQIQKEEQLAAISWRDVSSISSNKNRILSSNDAIKKLLEICTVCGAP